jgi:hypothetical protein
VLGVTRGILESYAAKSEERMSSEAKVRDDIAVPVILDFAPISCSVHINQNRDNSVPSSIRMGIRLSPRHNVSTKDERSLNKIDWDIELFEGANTHERLSALGAIGMATYFPATQGDDYAFDEGCSIWAHLEKDPFALLSRFVLSGRLPESIRVHAKGGLRYGGSHDGSEKTWDIESNTDSSVQQVHISMGVVAEPDDDVHIAQISRPITAETIEGLEHSLARALDKSLEAIALRLNLILAVVALFAAISLFH